MEVSVGIIAQIDFISLQHQLQNRVVEEYLNGPHEECCTCYMCKEIRNYFELPDYYRTLAEDCELDQLFSLDSDAYSLMKVGLVIKIEAMKQIFQVGKFPRHLIWADTTLW